MRIYYLVAEFGRKVRTPGAGPLGGIKLDVKSGVSLYRDVDADPHTLVAEAKGAVYHYPWAAVQMSVVDTARAAEERDGKTKKAS